MYGGGNYRLDRLCWSFGLALMVFGSACRTVQGAGVIQAEKIKVKTETARKIIEKYNIKDEDEATLAELFDEIDREAIDLGKDRDKEAVKAEDNAAAARKWRWLVGSLVALTVLVCLWAGRAFIGRVFFGSIAK